MKIAVYTQEYLIRTSVVDFFRGYGYAVERINDLLESNVSKYNLVIVDCDNFPIKNLPQFTKYSELIIITSSISMQDIEFLKVNGITNLLLKPFNFKTFKNKVNKVITL